MSYFYASEGMVITREDDDNAEMQSSLLMYHLHLLNDLQKAASVSGVNDLILESDGTNHDTYSEPTKRIQHLIHFQ